MDLGLLFNTETTQIVISVLLATFGGVARLLSQKEKIAPRTSNVLSGCLVASFTGVLAYFTVSYLNLSDNIVYIAAGICGWIGPQVVNVIANLILQSVGLNLQMINEHQLTLKDPDARLIDDAALPQLTVKRRIKPEYEIEEPIGWLEPFEEPLNTVDSSEVPPMTIEAPPKKRRRSKKRARNKINDVSAVPMAPTAPEYIETSAEPL